MPDIHLTRDLLHAVARGELPTRTVISLGLEHLVALCPVCRDEYHAWRAERRARASIDPGHAREMLPVILEQHAESLRRQERAAERDLVELLALPPEEREPRIRRARSRFRGAALIRALITESERHIHTDPGEAYGLAELARKVSHESPRAVGVFDLIALATAHMGNALRAAGALREADPHFGHVRHLASRHPVTDSAILARVAELEGSLRKDQRRFREARDLFNHAIMLYRVAGSTRETARVALKLGSLHYSAGNVDAAIYAVRTALARISQDSDRRLYLCARHNLTLYLAEASRYIEAAHLLEQDTALYREFLEPWTQLRYTWLSGKIAAGLGDLVAAEAHLRAVRAGFVEQSNGYDAALASLDLALLYLQQGRCDEVRTLAEELLPLFAAQDLHREAAAALVLLADAAQREELTARLLHELAGYFRAAKADPSLRFGDAS